jgi:hypothetical protein
VRQNQPSLPRYIPFFPFLIPALLNRKKSVLASSMKLEYSLNNTVPSTTHSRDRLLAKMFQYRKDAAGAEEGTTVATDEDFEILYVFTLVTGQLAEEIKKVEKEVEDLFGVMDEESLKLQ